MSVGQIEALLTAAEEYAQMVSTLDRQSKETRDRDRGRRSAETLAKLKQFQQQKLALIGEIVGSLSGRLGVDGSDKLRRYINESFKRKVKIKGKPNTPSGTGSKAPTVATLVNDQGTILLSSTSRKEELS